MSLGHLHGRWWLLLDVDRDVEETMSEQLAEKIAREIYEKFFPKFSDSYPMYSLPDRPLAREGIAAIIQRHLSESQERQPHCWLVEHPLPHGGTWMEVFTQEENARGYARDRETELRVKAKVVPLYDAPPSPIQPVAADARRDCRGNETGYHTCGLPIGGCGKNTPPAATEDAPCPDDVCGDAFTHSMPVAHVHNKIHSDNAAVAQPEAENDGS